MPRPGDAASAVSGSAGPTGAGLRVRLPALGARASSCLVPALPLLTSGSPAAPPQRTLLHRCGSCAVRGGVGVGEASGGNVFLWTGGPGCDVCRGPLLRLLLFFPLVGTRRLEEAGGTGALASALE